MYIHNLGCSNAPTSDLCDTIVLLAAVIDASNGDGAVKLPCSQEYYYMTSSTTVGSDNLALAHGCVAETRQSDGSESLHLCRSIPSD